MGTTVLLQPGARLQFDGELLEVVQVEALRVTLRDARGRWRSVGMAEFLSAAKPAQQPGTESLPALGTRLSALSDSARKTVVERAAHVRELLTGYRSGTEEVKGPGEPRPEYEPARPLLERQAAKARELGVTDRTIRNWIRDYSSAGEAGLVDSRLVERRGSTVDPRWEEACAVVMKRKARDSTLTAGAMLRLANAHLDEQYGEGTSRARRRQPPTVTWPAWRRARTR